MELIREPEDKKKKKKRIFGVITITMVIILVGIMAAILIYRVFILSIKRYNSYETLNQIERSDGDYVRYMPADGNILRYSRDGISLINGKGNEIWNAAYEMKNPNAVMSGNYTAVADIGNRLLYVIDNKGGVTKVTIDLPIIEIALSEQGETAVLMEDTDQYFIRIYDPYAPGDMLKAEIRTVIEKDGYPLAIALSKDGAKLVTSYFDIDNGKTQSKITFYSFTDVGENAGADHIVGAYPYEGKLFPKVEFLSNNIVALFGDSEYTLFSMKEKPKELHTEIFNSKVKKVFSNEKGAGFLLENNSDSDTKYILKMYGLDGQELLSKKINDEYDNIYAYNEEVILYSSTLCTIYRFGGNQKFRYSFEDGIYYFMPGKFKNKYFLINSTSIEEVKLVEEN